MSGDKTGWIKIWVGLLSDISTGEVNMVVGLMGCLSVDSS